MEKIEAQKTPELREIKEVIIKLNKMSDIRKAYEIGRLQGYKEAELYLSAAT